MPSRPIIVGLGEILWDVFPDGPRFGGAPANFACSVAELRGTGVQVHVASAVGRDDLGSQALELLKQRNVDTSCVATLERPTGTVLVQLDAAGHASYAFAADTAWDNIPWSDGLHRLAASADVVCFGTLGQRSDASRQTIERFVRATRPEALRILDVNLRPPFWTTDVVRTSLELANVVKLNDTELATVAKVQGWSGTNLELLQRLLEEYALRAAALTRGADGAILLGIAGEHSNSPAEPTTVADTVGAGDAYSAALAIGLLENMPLDAINTWGIRIASWVCSQPGATPHLPQHLQTP